jgi:hypothetical protein
LLALNHFTTPVCMGYVLSRNVGDGVVAARSIEVLEKEVTTSGARGAKESKIVRPKPDVLDIDLFG